MLSPMCFTVTTAPTPEPTPVSLATDQRAWTLTFLLLTLPMITTQSLPNVIKEILHIK